MTPPSHRGALVAGCVVAILAAVLLIVGIRSTNPTSSGPLAVLVAKRLIPKGTTGNAIWRKELYLVTVIPSGQVEAGAISDPANFRGLIVVADILPGQQLTSADFTAEASDG